MTAEEFVESMGERDELRLDPAVADERLEGDPETANESPFPVATVAGRASLEERNAISTAVESSTSKVLGDARSSDVVITRRRRRMGAHCGPEMSHV